MKLDVHVQLMALKVYMSLEKFDKSATWWFTPLLSHGISHNIHIIW